MTTASSATSPPRSCDRTGRSPPASGRTGPRSRLRRRPALPARSRLRRRRHSGRRGRHDPPGPRQPAGLGGPLLAGDQPGTRLAGRREACSAPTPRPPTGSTSEPARSRPTPGLRSWRRRRPSPPRSTDRVDAVNAYLEGTGPLPDGLGVTAAEQKVEAVEAGRRAGRRGRQPSPPAVGESVAAGRLGRSPTPGRATQRPRSRPGGRLAAGQAQPAALVERRPDRLGRDLARRSAGLAGWPHRGDDTRKWNDPDEGFSEKLGR